MTDLDAIRERHQPSPSGRLCVWHAMQWPCDTAQALARVDELEAALRAFVEPEIVPGAALGDAYRAAWSTARAFLTRPEPVSDFGIQVVIGPEPKP